MIYSKADRLIIRELNANSEFKALGQPAYYVQDSFLSTAKKCLKGAPLVCDVPTLPAFLLMHSKLSKRIYGRELAALHIYRQEDTVRIAWCGAHNPSALPELFYISFNKEAQVVDGGFEDDRAQGRVESAETSQRLMAERLYSLNCYGGDKTSFIEDLDNLFWDARYILTFMTYATVEEKDAQGSVIKNRRQWSEHTPLGERAIVLDASFYTTIIRSEGFGVKGHFRLQPYKKDGEWAKRLIWIEAYQKKGYTRTAKKLLS